MLAYCDTTTFPRFHFRVLVSKTRKGFVRFVGPTEFAAGIWVGVELEEPRGKNNGTVDGKKYFNCKVIPEIR